MLPVPAWAWRGRFVYRAVCMGIPVGFFFATLTFAESGKLPGALVVFVVLSALNGILTARRMRQFWPGADDLGAGDRVEVVRAARRGQVVDDARIAPAAIDYGAGLRAARAEARQRRWVLWLGAAAVLALAVVDSLFATFRLALVSWLFVAFLVIDLFWWPRRQDQLVDNADRTAQSAHRIINEKR